MYRMPANTAARRDPDQRKASRYVSAPEENSARTATSLTVTTGSRVRIVRAPRMLSNVNCLGAPKTLGAQRLNIRPPTAFSRARVMNPSMSVPAGSRDEKMNARISHRATSATTLIPMTWPRTIARDRAWSWTDTARPGLLDTATSTRLHPPREGGVEHGGSPHHILEEEMLCDDRPACCAHPGGRFCVKQDGAKS